MDELVGRGVTENDSFLSDGSSPEAQSNQVQVTKVTLPEVASANGGVSISGDTRLEETPVTNVPALLEPLVQAAQNAADTVDNLGSFVQPVYGSLVHSQFEDNLNGLGASYAA